MLVTNAISLINVIAADAAEINLNGDNHETFSAAEDDKVIFTSSDTKTEISFLRVGEDKVLINLNPGNKILLYKIGDTKDFSVDQDEITLTLDSIKDGKAELTIKKTQLQEFNLETKETEENNAYKILALILSIFIISASIILFIRRRKVNRD